MRLSKNHFRNSANGWWNPEGGAVFDFQDCTVKQLISKDGTVTNTGSLIGELVKGADGRATGKMVDLDPQQQGCSQLWAVRLRILTKQDELLLDGYIEATAFRDLQYRQTGGIAINGQPLGGTWTSVLKDITWGEKAADYAFFKELKETTQGDKLSVNLNGFGYYYNHADNGRFSLEKILGAIGPWFEGEPDTFVPHRRLYGIVNQSTSARGTQVFFSNTNFLFDQAARRLSIDFGASFPVANSLGTVQRNNEYVIGISHRKLANYISKTVEAVEAADFTELGSINYQSTDYWLTETGGFVDIEGISEKNAAMLANKQLVLLNRKSDGTYTLIARESIDGYLLRADNFVQRLDYNDINEVNFYAYQWGEKLKSGTIKIDMQPATPITPKGPNNPISEIPGNNYPRDGVTFEETIDLKEGFAPLKLTGNKIINPRGYIDGQIYSLDYALDGISNDPAEGPMNNDNISIHLRDYFEVPEKPTWSDIADLMTQFSNLYPIMSKYIVDLSDPVAVRKKTEVLTFAFSRNIADPIYMPVTRELSEPKRETILKWLAEPAGKESKEELLALKSKNSMEKKLAESPAKPDQQLTTKQEKLKTAMRAKRGEFVLKEEFNNLRTMLKLNKEFVERLYEAKSIEALFPLVQNAIELEHATIPPYLTAMFSLKPGTEKEVWDIIHSIVIEEMMHMTIAANILNALGGSPAINNSKFVPEYPGTLPMGIGDGLVVSLAKYSKEQVKNVFMEIEEPEHPLPLTEALATAEPEFHTIGEFYEALSKMINKLAPEILPGDPKKQVTSPFFSEELLFPILTKQNAIDAIDIIVEQGEGTATSPVDFEGEIAHFYKFEELYRGKRLVKDPDERYGYSYTGPDIPFDAENVQPILPDTKANMFAEGSEARRRVDEFNASYQSLLNGLHETFNGNPVQLKDTIGLMFDIKLYGEKLCAMPFPGKTGTTIGPTFEFVELPVI